jgi:phosphatidylserine/phosphatidylglycerophosphate/cardiolipin synthase-like enzyme
MNFKALHKVGSESQIRDLANSIISGEMMFGWNVTSVSKVVGAEEAKAICEELDAAEKAGFTKGQVGHLVMTAYEGRKAEIDAERQFELIFSGPQIEGARAASTLQEFDRVVSAAQKELLIVTHSIYKAEKILESVVRRQAQGVKVTICYNISRNSPQNKGLPAQKILDKERQSFIKTWGDNNPIPQVYYFPLSLWRPSDPGVPAEALPALAGINEFEFPVLHTKCIIADRTLALVTSANLSDSAQRRNLELGVLIKNPSYAQKVSNYFDGAIKTKVLLPLFA